MNLTELSLAELEVKHRALRTHIREEQVELTALEDEIARRHARHAKLQQLSKLSPAEVDRVLRDEAASIQSLVNK